MHAEIGGDLLDRHTVIAIAGDPYDVVAELAGVGPRHKDILPAHPPGGKPTQMSPIRAADPDPDTARRRREPWPRTTDPSTISTNPVCAEPIRMPATPATPSTATIRDARPSTASTSAWRPWARSPTWPRSTPRSARRPRHADGPDAGHRAT